MSRLVLRTIQPLLLDVHWRTMTWSLALLITHKRMYLRAYVFPIDWDGPQSRWIEGWKVVKFDRKVGIARLSPPQVRLVCWFRPCDGCVLKRTVDGDDWRVLVWVSLSVSEWPAKWGWKVQDRLWIGYFELRHDQARSQHCESSRNREKLHDWPSEVCLVELDWSTVKNVIAEVHHLLVDKTKTRKESTVWLVTWPLYQIHLYWKPKYWWRYWVLNKTNLGKAEQDSKGKNNY